MLLFWHINPHLCSALRPGKKAADLIMARERISSLVEVSYHPHGRPTGNRDALVVMDPMNDPGIGCCKLRSRGPMREVHGCNINKHMFRILSYIE